MRIIIAIVAFVTLCMLFVTDVVSQTSTQTDKESENVIRQASKDTLKPKYKSPTGAMVRSLLFPGWGQWYNNKKLKALVVFGAETGLLINSIYLNQKVVQSQTDYEKEFYINNRNLSVWWLVGVTLFSMADAFVDAHLADFDESPDLSFLKVDIDVINHDQPVVRIGVCYRF